MTEGSTPIEGSTPEKTPGWFIAALIDLLTPTFYLWGDHVIEKGDTPESIIFVVDGAAEELLTSVDQDGRTKYECIGVYKQRCIIFEPAIRGGESEGFVRCITPLSTYHLERDSVDSLGTTDPLLGGALREALGATIARRLRSSSLRSRCRIGSRCRPPPRKLCTKKRARQLQWEGRARGPACLSALRLPTRTCRPSRISPVSRAGWGTAVRATARS